MDKPEQKISSRREFLRNSAGAAAVVATTVTAKSPVYAIAPARVIGANERIQIGHIGLGVQGYGAHARLLKEKSAENNTEQIAVCDLYGRRLRKAGTFLGLSESAWYTDYRKMLDNKDLDAVVVATSDNWHAQCVIDAMNAGKHAYCEKPMCKTLEEAYGIYDTVKKSGLKLQVGSQGCSDPMYENIAKIVKSGKIGKLVRGQHSYNRGDNKIGEWNSYGDHPFKAPHDKAGPKGVGDDHIDWETFRKGEGPKEWTPDRFFRWRKYRAYGSGLVGDLMPHRILPMFKAMAIPTTGMDGFPKRVSSGGVLAVQKVNPDTKELDRDVPDYTYMTVDFEDFSMIIMSTTINEQGMRPMIRGNKATILFSNDKAQIIPERAYSDEVEAETIPVFGNGEPIPVHQKNWIDCIRNGNEPNCNIDLSLRAQVLITMGEIAYRNSVTLAFDPKSRSTTPDIKKFPKA
ncbi:MAG: Gfo/Idh/MocA family protein [Actinomycetota bacterium]